MSTNPYLSDEQSTIPRAKATIKVGPRRQVRFTGGSLEGKSNLTFGSQTNFVDSSVNDTDDYQPQVTRQRYQSGSERTVVQGVRRVRTQGQPSFATGQRFASPNQGTIPRQRVFTEPVSALQSPGSLRQVRRVSGANTPAPVSNQGSSRVIRFSSPRTSTSPTYTSGVSELRRLSPPSSRISVVGTPITVVGRPIHPIQPAQPVHVVQPVIPIHSEREIIAPIGQVAVPVAAPKPKVTQEFLYESKIQLLLSRINAQLERLGVQDDALYEDIVATTLENYEAYEEDRRLNQDQDAELSAQTVEGLTDIKNDLENQIQQKTQSIRELKVKIIFNIF